MITVQRSGVSRRVARKGGEGGTERIGKREGQQQGSKEGEGKGGGQDVRKRRVEIKGASDTGWWATKVQPLALLFLDI